MDLAETEGDPSAVRLMRPVLLAAFGVIAVLYAMVFVSLRQVDDHSAAAEAAKARAFVSLLADQEPDAVVAALSTASFDRVRYSDFANPDDWEVALPLLTAEGLRRGFIMFAPDRPGLSVFTGTIHYKLPIILVSVGVLALLLVRLVRHTRQIEKRRMQARRLALTDSLSGLPNRRHFDMQLAEALTDMEAGGAPVTLYFIDLDGFKPINDIYGHAAGDELIRQVSRRLVDCIDPRGMRARLSGDEFAIVRRDAATPDRALALGRMLVHAIGGPIQYQGQTIQVGASVGIAIADRENAPAPDVLCRSADEALYAAKRKGRRRAELYGDPLAAKLPEPGASTAWRG